MKTLINDYFKSKKINAEVINVLNSDNFETYVISLKDINNLKKFNTAMQKELSYILKHNVTIKIDDDITITLNKTKLSKNVKTSKGVTINIGRDTHGEDVLVNFKSNPHWLVGGSTGSGKSVFVNNVIGALIEQYNECIEFGFVDLKQVEFYRYNNLSMNVCDVANDIDSALLLLDYAINVMNARYETYKLNGVLDIDSYNEIAEEKDKYFFIIIDELAELILQNKKEVLKRLQRLLQLGRASGVYVICATQRPSADVISGTLKVNFTTRICFKVANAYDSRTIINQKGAELLCGNGDGLVLKNGDFEVIRFQGYKPVDNNDIIDLFKEYKDNRYFNMIDFVIPIKNALKDIFQVSSIIGGGLIKIMFYVLIFFITAMVNMVVWFLIFLKTIIRK